jgi:isochorismate hydrolase
VLLLKGRNYKTMDRTNLIQQVEEKGEEDVVVEGVPVCGANLVSPVTDTAYFIEQVHYKIGTRLYIENAD